MSHLFLTISEVSQLLGLALVSWAFAYIGVHCPSLHLLYLVFSIRSYLPLDFNRVSSFTALHLQATVFSNSLDVLCRSLLICSFLPSENFVCLRQLLWFTQNVILSSLCLFLFSLFIKILEVVLRFTFTVNIHSPVVIPLPFVFMSCYYIYMYLSIHYFLCTPVFFQRICRLLCCSFYISSCVVLCVSIVFDNAQIMTFSAKLPSSRLFRQKQSKNYFLEAARRRLPYTSMFRIYWCL